MRNSPISAQGSYSLTKLPSVFRSNLPVAQSIRRQVATELIAHYLLALCWALLLLLLAATSPAHAANQSGVVSRVIDGDTVWLKTAFSRKPLKVRIAGIDAPEICQAGGIASRDALRQRLLGQTVTMVQTSSRRRDNYGRLLARIDLHGEDIGRWMVVSGHAWSYHFRHDAGLYAAEQRVAKAAGRGLFSQKGPLNPRQFRLQHGSCHP